MAPYLTELTVEQWGPAFWKVLHILASRMGSDVEITDADAANGMYFVVNQLPDVLPCADCAKHARTYIYEHKFNPRGLFGSTLRTYVEDWLLHFHNSVRVRKGQPILLRNVEEYHAVWSPQRMIKCDYDGLTLYFNYGKMYKIIDIPKFKVWNNQFQRLRLLLGV